MLRKAAGGEQHASPVERTAVGRGGGDVRFRFERFDERVECRSVGNGVVRGDQHVPVAADAQLGAQRLGRILAHAVHQPRQRRPADQGAHAAPAAEPDLALDVRGAQGRGQTMPADELRSPLRNLAQRGEAPAIVRGGERPCVRRRRERGLALDRNARRPRSRRQLEQRGDRIGGELLVEQRARHDDDSGCDDVDRAGEWRRRLAELRGDRVQRERQRPEHRRREHPAEQTQLAVRERAADDPAGVRGERSGRFERAGIDCDAVRDQHGAGRGGIAQLAKRRGHAAVS